MKTLRSRGHRVLLAVLIEARHQEGLTQRQLSERLGLPRSYVSKIETGQRKIDPIECVAWARACRVSAETFFIRFVRAMDRRF